MHSPPDAVELASLIRDGELTARDAVAESIDRIEAFNPAINAVVAQRYDEALAEVDHLPEGPLHGVPMLIKDLGAQVAGLPATRGSRLWADCVATADTALVAAYRAAGAVILGTTNTPELGRNASTEPVLHGATRNPWGLGHSTGGSSGGSAAAVASGMVPVAHAGDGGGSIRIPAAMCGLVGLKPSRGRVTRYPDASALPSPLAADHVVSRSVRDSALLLDVAAHPIRGGAFTPPRPDQSFSAQLAHQYTGLRIGLVVERADGGDVHPEMAAAAQRAAKLLAELGHHIEPTKPFHDAGIAMSAFSQIMGAGLVHEVEGRLAELGRELRDDDLEPFTRVMFDHYREALRPTDLYDALSDAQRLGWHVGTAFDTFDLLLTPTVPTPTPELGVLDTTRPEVMYAIGGELTAFTNIANLTGQPAISVPMGQGPSGLPVGVQLLADLGQEGLLLSLAARLEEAAPWQLVAATG